MQPGLVRSVWLVALAALFGCSSGDAALRFAAPTHQLFVEASLGIAFSAPSGWQSRAERGGIVLAGAHGDDSLTTLALQAAPAWPLPSDAEDVLDALIASLEATYDHVGAEAEATILGHAPARCAGQLGVRYVVGLTVNEQELRRVGCVFEAHGIPAALRYTAPIAHFSSGIGVFETALESLALLPPDGGRPLWATPSVHER